MARPDSNIPQQVSTAVLGLPQPPLRKASEYLKSYSSWTYGAVNVIAQEFSNIELHLYTRRFTTKEVQIDEVTEHEALSLLSNPNDYMTHYQLFEITQIYLELTGEAYWTILRDTSGNPIQLWPLRPDWVKVIPSNSFIDGYRYAPDGIDDSKSLFIKTSDMIPFKYPNPTNVYRGYGVVQAASMAIDTDQFSADWNRTFFFNGAIPYLILRSKKKPSKAEMERFLQEWNAKMQGRGNSHKVAVLGGEWEDPFVFGDKIRDMDFAEQRRMMRDEILGMFRVGKSMLNITEDVNRANAEASNINFMERVVTPKMIRFVAHLNEFYLRNWADQDLFFDFKDPAPQDVELNLKIYENGKNYWLTPNEIRERENLPPIEGGDDIYMPLTVTPIGKVVDAVKGFFGKKSDQDVGLIRMEGKKSVKKRTFMMPIPPKRLSLLRLEAKKQELKEGIKHDLFNMVKHMLIEVKEEEAMKAKKGEGQQLHWTQEQREKHWEKMVSKTDVQEQKMRSEVNALFQEQEKSIQRNIEQSALKFFARGRKKGKENSLLFNIIAENKKWQKALEPLIHSIVLDKGREVLAFLGLNNELDITQQVAQAFLKIEGLEFIKEVNEYTRQRLQKTLAEGLGKEEGVPELSKRVADIFDIARGSRSQKIARTEVLRSTNFATLQAYRQSNVVVGKEWLTAKDERVDPLCQALDGTVVSLEKTFKEGSFSGKYPPLHPNCRCTLIPVLKSK